MKRKGAEIQTGAFSRRLVPSFLAVLILPVAIFSFLFLHNFYRIYQKKILEQAQANLDAARMDLERQLEELSNIADYHSSFVYLQGSALRKSYRADEISEALAAGVTTHPILDNIFYFNFDNQDVIYSMNGTYSRYYFLHLYFGMENGQLGEIMDGVRHSWLYVPAARKNGSPGLCYAVKRTYGWWLFLLSPGTLADILGTEEPVVLLDAEGARLFPFEEENAVRGEAEQYEIVSESPDGFCLVRTVDKESLFAELYRWQALFFLILAAVLLAGGALILFLSFWHERPVVELQYYCREKIQNIPKTMQGFELFRFAMQQMEEHVSLLERQQRQNSFAGLDQQFRSLYRVLLKADFEEIGRIMESLEQIIEERKNSPGFSLAVYYNVLNIYCRAMAKMSTLSSPAALDNRLLDVKDSGDAVRMMRSLTEQFKAYVDRLEEEKKEKHVISKVIDYIEENRKSGDLNAGAVAEHFHMSVSNLSHQFRQQTNYRISDYINEKKFEYAAELLKGTSYRIADIAGMLGYMQTSSFIRQFRNYYGMTPREYRDSIAAEEE